MYRQTYDGRYVPDDFYQSYVPEPDDDLGEESDRRRQDEEEQMLIEDAGEHLLWGLYKDVEYIESFN